MRYYENKSFETWNVYGEKKNLYGKELPSSDHLFWKWADMNQTNVERLSSYWKWGLSNDDKKKKRQIKPSENSGSFTVYQLSAKYHNELFFVVYREFDMKRSQR